jgi:1,2-dihydroxy-3-keto-5-methylthiopentene dioxygenase
MAILQWLDGKGAEGAGGQPETDLAAIGLALGALGIGLRQWPMDAQIQSLLAQDALTAAEQDQVLAGLDHYFELLQRDFGYQSRDLIVLHPAIPDLQGKLAKFAEVHTHDDDEVRYIVAGEGIFGFVFPDGRQATLTVQPAEYINVPAGTEHWFELTADRRVKAVRYFCGTAGWVPNYTGTVRQAAAVA